MDQLSTLADRLRQARQEARLSTREVANRLPTWAKVSHVTLASYEKGATSPDLRTLTALADVFGRPPSWFLNAGPLLAGVQYRMLRSVVTVTQQRQYEAAAARWLNAYWQLDNRIASHIPSGWTDLNSLLSGKDESPQEAAGRIRSKLGIGASDPIRHLVRTIEDTFPVRVMTVDTDAAVSGFAGRFGGDHAIILNTTPGAWDRLRLTFAHEVAHILYRDCDLPGLTEREIEAKRFEFGFYLLMPPWALREAFVGRSVVKMVKFKELFGVSLAAMIYRAGQEKILNEKDVNRLWIEFAKRGWKKAEPGAVGPDRPTRFEERYELAVDQRLITASEAETVMGVSGVEMRARLARASGGTIKDEADDGPGDDYSTDVIRFPGQV